MYDLHEVSIPAVEPVDQTRPDQGSSRIQCDNPAHPEEQVIRHDSAHVSTQGMSNARGTSDWQSVIPQTRQRGSQASGDRTHVGNRCRVTGRSAQCTPVHEEDVVAAVAYVSVTEHRHRQGILATCDSKLVNNYRPVKRLRLRSRNRRA